YVDSVKRVIPCAVASAMDVARSARIGSAHNAGLHKYQIERVSAARSYDREILHRPFRYQVPQVTGIRQRHQLYRAVDGHLLADSSELEMDIDRGGLADGNRVTT